MHSNGGISACHVSRVLVGRLHDNGLKHVALRAPTVARTRRIIITRRHLTTRRGEVTGRRRGHLHHLGAQGGHGWVYLGTRSGDCCLCGDPCKLFLYLCSLCGVDVMYRGCGCERWMVASCGLVGSFAFHRESRFAHRPVTRGVVGLLSSRVSISPLVVSNG